MNPGKTESEADFTERVRLNQQKTSFRPEVALRLYRVRLGLLGIGCGLGKHA